MYSDESLKGSRLYCLMLFSTELELGISDVPGRWVNTRNVRFTDGARALDAYASTPNPASQLVDADSEEELREEIRRMRENYRDEAWLDANLYPYL